ncbi:MAG: TonB-dependent receptor [Bacteroidetes bacterium]|nr:TonB-dependent receptor [Bacteroidota bacterium]
MNFLIKIYVLSAFAVLFLLSSKSGIAQSGRISGKVVEIESQEPLQYATVALFQSNDSVNEINGTTTDIEGNFLFQQIDSGNYFLKVSFIGFKTMQTPVFWHSGQTNLGKINIEADPILLEDVTISSEKSALIHTVDKKIYNVGQDILSETGSATEILQNIPSVSVDVEGNVTLRGTSNILYLVNGKPSALLRRSAASALQQIPAASIERIEVITNPSAKYKPEGTGGIINIILRKDKRGGLNGQISAGIGNEKRYNANLNLNYGSEKVNIFANYGIRHFSRRIYYSDNRIYRDSTGGEVLSFYMENASSKTNALAHIASAGVDFNLNENNTLEFSGDFFSQNSLHESDSDIAEDDSDHQPKGRLTSNETNDEFEHELELAATWEHLFDENEDHTLSIDITGSTYNEQEDQTYYEIYTFPQPVSEKANNLVRKQGQQAEISAEYVLPLNEDFQLEGGYYGEFIHEDIRYTKNMEPDRFLLNQDVHAVYVLLEQELDDFTFKAGLRAEQAYIKSHLLQPSDSLIPNSYFKLFPTLHMGYDLSNNSTIGFSYSRRINRPDADELNPNPEFYDPRNAEAGNPNLKPQQIHSIELAFNKKGKKLSFSPAIYYRYTYDAFSSIKIPVGDSILITTIENLDNRQSAGLEGIISSSPLQYLDLNLSTDIFYDQIDATSLGFSDKKSVVSFNIKFHSYLKATNSTMIQIDAYYYSPRITPQGQRNQFFYMNAGVRQQLFAKRAVATLTVSDIFHTYRITREIDVPQFYQESKYRRKGAVIQFGFTYFIRSTNNNNDKELKFEGEGL